MHEDRRGAEEGDQKVYSAEDVRQGEIILRTPLRRAIFIAGLAAAVVLPLLFMWFG
jgi:hypothetical protein